MKRTTNKSSSKSSSKKVNVKFDFKDPMIFQKETTFEGKPFIIRGIFDFTKPDIILKERE
jgi:hypothetical protein